jgi:hypothetical protein
MRDAIWAKAVRRDIPAEAAPILGIPVEPI